MEFFWREKPTRTKRKIKSTTYSEEGRWGWVNVFGGVKKNVWSSRKNWFKAVVHLPCSFPTCSLNPRIHKPSLEIRKFLSKSRTTHQQSTSELPEKKIWRHAPIATLESHTFLKVFDGEISISFSFMFSFWSLELVQGWYSNQESFVTMCVSTTKFCALHKRQFLSLSSWRP